MSMSLIVLIPVMLLGIVGMLCFVGCVLHTEGLPATPFNEYSNKTVLNNPAIMAYWPLNDPLKDTDNPAPAVERVSNIASSYIDRTTAPELYPAPEPNPWPDFPVPNPPAADVLSAAAPGTIAFGQPGIVKGDAVALAMPSVIQPCVVVNGCYVEAPFNPKFVPQGSFTVEAWVRVDWTAGDPQAWRFVLDMRDFNPRKGFGLFAMPDPNQPGVYRWAAMVGNGGPGSGGFTTLTTSEGQITLSGGGTPPDPVYLALTYNGQTLTLFVNGDPQGHIDTAYLPNISQPLWIGAGAPYVTRRPLQPAGEPGSPLFPFVGAIQNVAIYSKDLMAADIRTHFRNGNAEA
jgi:hypothetical protein